MAKAELVKEVVTTVKGVTLNLDPTEAGQLLNVLNAHLAGEIVRHGSLGQVRLALRDAGVREVKMINENRERPNGKGKQYGYAVLDRVDSDLCDND